MRAVQLARSARPALCLEEGVCPAPSEEDGHLDRRLVVLPAFDQIGLIATSTSPADTARPAELRISTISPA